VQQQQDERSQRARDHYDGVWSVGDTWQFESSEFEQRKYHRQIELISDRRYLRAMELGCGAGAFTRMLAPHTDRLLAIDVAPAAIERARGMASVPPNVEFVAQDIMKLDRHAGGPWDLIVMSETICCLGGLYTCFDVGWLASDLLAATAVGGRFLMVNTMNAQSIEYLLRPWLVYTYRDLFLHVGFELEHEETLKGEKHGLTYKSLLSLYQKTRPSVPPNEIEPAD
jgi:predicted TPR repeat methyltransferase